MVPKFVTLSTSTAVVDCTGPLVDDGWVETDANNLGTRPPHASMPHCITRTIQVGLSDPPGNGQPVDVYIIHPIFPFLFNPGSDTTSAMSISPTHLIFTSANGWVPQTVSFTAKSDTDLLTVQETHPSPTFVTHRYFTSWQDSEGETLLAAVALPSAPSETVPHLLEYYPQIIYAVVSADL